MDLHIRVFCHFEQLLIAQIYNLYKSVTMYEKSNTIYNYNYICGNIIFMLHIALYLSI